MKKCSKCGNVKDDLDFGIYTYGLRNICKNCHKKDSNTYYYKNREAIRAKARNRDRTQENKKHREAYATDFYYRLYFLISGAQRRAGKANLAFDLDKDWIKKQLPICAKTKIHFDLSQTKAGCNPFAPSVDRIDSKKGYTKENTQIVCWAYNAGKNGFDEDIYVKFCRAVADHNPPNITFTDGAGI